MARGPSISDSELTGAIKAVVAAGVDGKVEMSPAERLSS